jgi:hypothetical protein
VVVAAGVGVFAATSDDDADTATALAAAATTPTVAQRTVVSAPEGDAPARAAVPLEPAPAPALAPEDTSVPPASSAGAASEGAEKVDVAKVPRRPSTSRSTKEIRKTLRRQVEAGAKRCLEKEGAFAGERVDVNFTIDPDGSVKAARAGRKHANTPMGQCVEQAVRDASFSEASEPQTVEHAFSL